jgi:hypothetical protein
MFSLFFNLAYFKSPYKEKGKETGKGENIEKKDVKIKKPTESECTMFTYFLAPSPLYSP